MAYETVLYEVSERICTITLNRPDKLNAWTRQMHLDLKAAMHAAGADDAVRAIILTGAGRGLLRRGRHGRAPGHRGGRRQLGPLVRVRGRTCQEAARWPSFA